MARLTTRDKEGNTFLKENTLKRTRECFEKCASYEDATHAEDGAEILSVDEIAELARAKQEGRLVVLPLPMKSTIYMEADQKYPVVVDDVGVWLQALEEGMWVTLDEFAHDYASDIEAAQKALEGKA